MDAATVIGKRGDIDSSFAQDDTEKQTYQSEAVGAQADSKTQRDRINQTIAAMSLMVDGEVRERMMAGFHNHDQATNGKNLLLSLPKEVRLEIFRLAVIKAKSIMMNHLVAQRTPSYLTPALLTVSKQIRAEAVEFYYKNNDFVLRVTDFDILPYKPFLKIYKPYGKSFPKDTTSGFCGFWVIGAPSWKNLLSWCQETYFMRAPF
ncbi:hypothetical protein LTS10_012051 [Elasticomyces elasticus]|nr:hypothetical protein LTS10_012051 [Elasticomyces elasticus]